VSFGNTGKGLIDGKRASMSGNKSLTQSLKSTGVLLNENDP